MRTILKTNLLVGVVALLLNITAFSQTEDLSNYSPRKLKSMGYSAMSVGDTYSAIEYLKAYCDKKKNKPKVLFDLAECYRATRNYIPAATYYDKTMRLDKNNLVSIYHYGEMLKVYGYYDEAKKYFVQFKQLYKGGYDVDYKRLVTQQIIACDSAQKLIDSAQSVQIKRLNKSINKASVELSPIYLNDTTLLYASLRTDNPVVTETEDPSAMPYRHFYTATKVKNEWQFKQEWNEGEFNQDLVHSGNGAFSPDKKSFYFTRCESDWQYKTNCKIYVSNNNKGRWSEPELLPATINMKHTNNTQPAVGTDSKRGDLILYFVSDRPDGKGGLDIWYSTFLSKKNEWREAKNCGNKINTAGDEITPFYQMKERNLYFSSNGWYGLGEQDVFRATGEMTKWTPAENVGYPINTGFDDIYFSADAMTTNGFLVSNRQSDKNVSTCCDDIFSYKYVDAISVGVEGTVMLIPNATIEKIINDNMEQVTNRTSTGDTVMYAEGSIVSLFLIDKNVEEPIFIAADTTDEKGHYFFDILARKDYMLQFESDKKLPPEMRFTTKHIFTSDTLQMDAIGIDYLSKDAFRIKNIYYDFDKSNLTLESKKIISRTILYIMNEYPQIVVEIGSHTDNKGGDRYNLRLSQKRAESVVNYLVQNGIDPNRLRAKGYGEMHPIAPNSNEDGSDNPEGRAKNRRTEFRVIGTLNQYFEIIYEE